MSAHELYFLGFKVLKTTFKNLALESFDTSNKI